MPFVLTLCLAIATFAAPAVRFPLQPRSDSFYVRGAAFDRIFQIWLENADYDVSFPNLLKVTEVQEIKD